ncbi:MAG: peptide deformylase [Gammaproteobacteria bacterium]|nr:peptide deformylase [Gammaproteobacteria bacterium]
MAIRKVLRMGDPRLLRISMPVTALGTPELRGLVADLQETMLAAGGAGIAAPQIGVPLRVVIFGGRISPRYPDAEAVPYTVLCNPLLEPLGTEQVEDWEGCLSVPGLRGRVPRWRRLRYRGSDPEGVAIERTVEDFHARVVQHEVDHLDGILYPMRIRDFASFGFEAELFPGADLPDE